MIQNVKHPKISGESGGMWGHENILRTQLSTGVAISIDRWNIRKVGLMIQRLQYDLREKPLMIAGIS